jgi:hypothetical protein
MHGKFICGITGVVRTDYGRLLPKESRTPTAS